MCDCDQQPTGVRKVAHVASNALAAAPKLAQVVIGVNRTEPDEYARRSNTCFACPEQAHGYCGEPLIKTDKTCGCLINWKIALASERCPQGKW